MITVNIYWKISGAKCMSRSFNSMPDARDWAEGYCRRNPECDWEVA